MWRRRDRAMLYLWIAALAVGAAAQWLEDDTNTLSEREERQAPDFGYGGYGRYGGYGGYGGYSGYGGYGGHGGYAGHGGFRGGGNGRSGFGPGFRDSYRRPYVNNQIKSASLRQQPAAGRAPKPVPATKKAGGSDGGACGTATVAFRVTFGKEAERGSFPWQAALVYDIDGTKSVECGGSLIHPSFVLTAAHCLDPVVIKTAKLVEVRLGLVDQRTVDAQARAFVPDRRIVHPQYTQGLVRGVRNANDIALLHLPQAAPYTEYIRPVCLPSPQQRLGKGTQEPVLVVSGWGTTHNASHSNKLLFAPVPLMDSAQCSTSLGVTIPETQLCAGGKKEDSCKGDSGGPLIQAAVRPNREAVFELVGIVSFGNNPCGKESVPGAYTRVAPYVGWIQQVIGQQG